MKKGEWGQTNTGRRTDVFTFDGNQRKGPKVMYGRIQKHLCEKYNAKIGYHGVAQVTSR
jgi:hypothetical protein